MSTTSHAFAPVHLKRQDTTSRIIEGIATTPTPDRVGDIVEPKGATFKLPMPLLWQHDPNKPIGLVLAASVTDEGIKFKARIEASDEAGTLKDRLDEAWQCVSKGLVRAVSIGFSTLEPPELLRTGGLRFLKWNWFELSLVTIPANADATIDTIKSAARRQRAKERTGADRMPDDRDWLKARIKLLERALDDAEERCSKAQKQGNRWKLLASL